MSDDRPLDSEPVEIPCQDVNVEYCINCNLYSVDDGIKTCKLGYDLSNMIMKGYKNV